MKKLSIVLLVFMIGCATKNSALVPDPGRVELYQNRGLTENAISLIGKECSQDIKRVALDLRPQPYLWRLEHVTELSIYSYGDGSDISPYTRLNVGWQSGGANAWHINEESDYGLSKDIGIGINDHNVPYDVESISIIGTGSRFKKFSENNFGSVVVGYNSTILGGRDMLILSPPELTKKGVDKSHAMMFVSNYFTDKNKQMKWRIYSEVVNEEGDSKLSITKQLDSGDEIPIFEVGSTADNINFLIIYKDGKPSYIFPQGE